MTDHDCPFTLGQLMATHAILTQSAAPGAARLAALFLDHARQHPAPQETTDAEA